MATRTRTPLRLARLEDGPDALPLGTAREQVPYTGAHRHLSVGIPSDMELYRLRTNPDLYPVWMVDMVDTYRSAIATAADMHDWDCRNCKSSVLTHRITDACPKCGTRANSRPGYPFV